MKKAISILMVFSMILTMLPAGSLLASASSTSGDYTYEVINSTARITAYSGSGGAVTIPEELGGYPVADIYDYAFYECFSLTAVIIPNCVTAIGYSSFYNCYNLTSVTFSNNLTKIDNYAFQKCLSLATVQIPDSVITIGLNAFVDTAWYNNQPNGIVYAGKVAYKYKGTTSSNSAITLKSDTKSISNSAFANCSWLVSLNIPGSVSIIGDSAFINCTALSSVNIGTGVTTIGNSAFYGCSNLVSITFPDSVTSIGNEAFNMCTFLRNVTVPDSVTTIGGLAFSNTAWYNSYPNGDIIYAGKVAYIYKGIMPANTSITLNPGTKGIAGSAFSLCFGLVSVTIPYGVLVIGDSAFAEDYGLTSVAIPDSVTTIMQLAFRGCTGLTSVTIGSGLTMIGHTPFYECSGLTQIIVDDNNLSYSSLDGVLFNKTKTSLVICPAGKSGEYTIPNSVNTIKEFAFYYCSKLTLVTIPFNLTKLEPYAFRGCTGLTAVTIPGSLSEIGDHAFYECSGLTSVTIEPGVKIIDSSAFDQCSGLITMTIPDSVTTIGAYAFSECTGLISVSIGTGVTSIGICCFRVCTKLIAAYFLGDAPSMEDNVFRDCPPEFIVYHLSSITSFTSPTWYSYNTETFSPISTINFDSNGGSAMTDITQRYDIAVTKPADPIKTGYTFGGWFSDPELTKMISWPYVLINNVTFYAKWNAIDYYTIVFDANGGSGGTNTTMLPGEALTAPTVTKTGYTFTGWSPAVPVAAPAENTVYIAQWTANTYNVTLNPMGGSPGISLTYKVTYGKPYGSLLTTTRSGYTFGGWYTGQNGTGTNILSTTVVTITAPQTLYAKWIAASYYTVSFNANGGSGTMSAQTIASGQSAALTSNAFVKTGYTFAGWATTSDGAVAYANGASYTMGSSNVTLYAKWTANSYTISYNGNGSTSGSTANSIHTYDVAKALTINGFSKTGCTFIGWASSSSGSVIYTDGQSVSNLCSSNGATAVLYAVWAINQYSIIFNTNGGSAVNTITQNYGTSIEKPTDPVKTGYTFAGWYADAGLTNPVFWPCTLGTSNVTFYAKWNLALEAPGSVASPSKTDTTVDLSWAAVTNAAGYNVYCGTQKLNDTPITSTTFTATGLTQDTDYSFTVTAVNGALESPASSAITVRTAVDVSNYIHFVVSNTEGFAGDTITVSAVVSANSNIAGATFEFPFDPNIFEYVSATKGAALSSGITSINYNETQHKITMTYINTEPLTAGGSVLDINFKIKADTAPQTINTSFSIVNLVNSDCNALPSTITQGTIGIKKLLGDVNNDGKVDVVDALMTLHHVSGYRLLNSSQVSAADVDKNGIVNIIDALKILQYSSGNITSF